jgi:hypothetical protein
MPGTESKIVPTGLKVVPPVSEYVPEMPKFEAVEHPAHYNRGGIETIDYLESTLSPEAFEGFLAGNVIKYVSRYPMKGKLEDLKKAQWYLDRLVKANEKPPTT